MPIINEYGPQQLRNLEGLRGQGALDQYVPSSNYAQMTATPQFMISMDTLLASTLENYTTSIQLFQFDFDISRFTNPNTTSQQYSSGRVQFNNPVVVIPNGIHTPNLINRLINGKLVEEIVITRLQNIDQENQAAEEITFESCYFQNIIPKYDVLIVSFRFVIYTHKTSYYDQKGDLQGNNQVTYDMSTGEINGGEQ